MNRKSVNRGLQLKFARQYRGYSQTSLCKQIPGLSQPNLSKFEKGVEGAISQDVLKAAMEHLEWPMAWLDVKHRCVNL